MRLSNSRTVVAFVRLLICLLICLAGRNAAGQTPAASGGSKPDGQAPATNGTPAASGASAASGSEGSKAADYSREAFVIEQYLTKIAFQNDGTSIGESTVRARVQSAAGVQEFGLLQLPYASANSTIDITYVRVIKPDGRTIETPQENILDMPAAITQQAPFYSDLKVKQVAVKGLEIGDTIEYRTVSETKTPMDPGQFWYSTDFFKRGVCLDEELQISVPRDRYVKVESPKDKPAISDEGSERTYTWKTSHLESASAEKDAKSDAADDQPQYPSVQITTFRNWDEFGQWFRGLAAPRAVPTPEIKAKADELTRGAKTDTEKIQALYNFVSTKFRYIGIALGIGRYQPHAAADVLTNDFGDCKDKHTLLAALLAAEGIKAYPALIRAEGDTDNVDPDVPSPLQFNHVITAVPQNKGYLFLDTTTEVGPFGYLVPVLRDKKALVIPDASAASLVQTPPDPPFKSVFTFQADGAIDETGTLTSKMQMTVRGDLEVAYRELFFQAGQAQWNDVVQQIVSSLGFGGTVTDATVTPPEATDAPLDVKYNYTRKEYSDWANRRIGPPFPGIRLPDVPEDEEKHPKPIKLVSSTDIVYEATVKLPANSNPTLPPAVHFDGDLGTYQADYAFSDGVLHVKRVETRKVREVLPAQMDGYKKWKKAIDDDVETYIPLSGGMSSSSSDISGSPEARTLYDEGRDAWQKRDVGGAADAFQQAVDKDPKFAQAWFALSAADMSLGDTDEAVAALKKAAALDPNEPANYASVTSALVAKHHEDDALEIWQQIEKENPQSPDAPRQVAAILIEMKRYAEAVPELESSTGRNPKDAYLQEQLATAYFHTGSPEKGAASAEKALALDQKPMTLNDVAYVLADNNTHLDEALRYAQQAVAQIEADTASFSLDKLTVKNVETMMPLAAAWDTLGWTHFRLGHFDVAEKYLKAGWYLDLDPTIAEHLGELYEKEGKTHEAALAYANSIAAGRAPEQAGTRLDAIKHKNPSEENVRPDPIALQDTRTVDVKPSDKPNEHASAEFFVLLGPDANATGSSAGMKVLDAKFLRGSDSLRNAGKALVSAKFQGSFPDDAEAHLVRRGILDCETEITNCKFAMYLPSAVHSAQ